jgi:hypothetical protein
MAIWKGKKKERKDPITQLCPRCLRPHLRYASSFSGIYAPPKFICPDCGYKCSIYVDIDGKDDLEELELKLLRDEFPDLIEEQKTIEELATECLNEKWLVNQCENHNSLRAWCPFCADANVICSICRCPPNICAKHATEGLIGKLNAIYDDEIELCNVDSEIYSQIVQAFQNLLIQEKK